MVHYNEATLIEVVQIYLNHLIVEKQLSSHTIDAYRRDLHEFCVFYQSLFSATECNENNDDGSTSNIVNGEDLISWKNIDEKTVRDYISFKHRQGLVSKSLHRHLSSLRGIYNYLIKEGHLNKNPALAVQAPRGERRLPKTLDTDQAQQLLNFKPNGFIETRDLAIIELFYSSGLRLSELTAINLHQIDFTACELVVTGKGGKSRLLPIGRHAIKALIQWKELLLT